MDAQHTPNKWGFRPVYGGGATRPWERFNIISTTPPCYDNDYHVNTGEKTTFIATVRASHSKKVTEANARLIAAAPELLEALIELLEYGGEEDRVTTGISEFFEPTRRCERARERACDAIAKAKGMGQS